ncbi:MAG: SET domain-containing protein-lysine N-methyltransferase [Geminicoccaceae bacterium]|nr:SET domain-containing protein-lysine N-methyltransferase [Geminicoccaceae bacterium]
MSGPVRPSRRLVVRGGDRLLQLRAIPGKGRGVFARRPIPAGRLLCRCPTLRLGFEDCARLNETALAKHFFTGDGPEFEAWLALGLLTLVNHGRPPNADWRYVDGGPLGCLVELVAVRPIAAGEEITIDYNTPLWFEPVP